MFQLSEAQIALAEAALSDLRRDLALEQGQRLMPGGVILTPHLVIQRTSSPCLLPAPRPHDREPLLRSLIPNFCTDFGSRSTPRLRPTHT